MTTTTTPEPDVFTGNRYERLAQAADILANDPAIIAAKFPYNSAGMRIFAARVAEERLLDGLTEDDANTYAMVAIIDLAAGAPAPTRDVDDKLAVIRRLLQMVRKAFLPEPGQDGPEPCRPTPRANIPLPAGAVFVDEWQPEGYRTIEGEQRQICQPAWVERFRKNLVIQVWTHALQHADGRVDNGEIEPPLISVNGLVWGDGISAATARQLADLLVTAADELDGWARTAGREVTR